MCGFAGFLAPIAVADDALRVLDGMADCLRHRGPDDHGTWYDAEAGIGLSHTRLAIVDVSAAGHQPMASPSGRYVLAFNGEIYNHRELRAELQANHGISSWRGHSDTETLLAGFETWGIEDTLRKCAGMFALAVWCRKTRTLSLARDRFGEKPLYYGWQGAGSRAFLFGSELKALRIHPAFVGTIDRNVLALYLRHNYIPSPYSIFNGISKLLPGHILSLFPHGETELHPYWSPTQIIADGAGRPVDDLDKSEVVNELDRLLTKAINRQMMADVPLGAFLSGGIDSSTVVALMQKQSNRPIKTFTIGFEDSDYNEAPCAKSVATHLGTDHTELYVTAQQAMDAIPSLPQVYDEPFADSSQIPTILLSRLARTEVTVSLSGDAGDELFAGYNRYALTQQLWSKLSRIPMPLRSAASATIRSISPTYLTDVLSRVQGMLPKRLRYQNVGDKLHKGAAVLKLSTVDQLYAALVSQWQNPGDVVLGGVEPETPLTNIPVALSSLSPVERMMALDTLMYLPDDILAKVDRAAMAASLETRVPFLDQQVFEFAWRIPLQVKQNEGEPKWPLRQVLAKYVPLHLFDRPKVGFGVPLHAWLRGPLRGWAESLLDEEKLRRQGYFEPSQVRNKWLEHLGGRRNWSGQLWTVLMFQSWLEANA